MALKDTDRIFHPKARKYTFFSSAHRTFSRMHHMLSHKTSLNKFKKTEIISSIFSDQNATKLEKQIIHKYVKVKQHTTEQPMDQRHEKEIFKKT